MVNPEQYIKEGLKIVDNLINASNLQAALNTCRELLKINPYHKKAQKKLQEIENLIVRKNIEKIDADIDSTMHLWEEKRFDELAKIYAELYKYAPQHSRLQKLIEKLNDELSEQQKNQKQDFVLKALADIANLTNEQKYSDAIQKGNELIAVDPLNTEVKAYLQKAKTGLIEQKLKENEHIEDCADFQRILDFYESLLAIDPANSKVKNSAFRVKEQLAHQKILAAKIHLNESIARMKDLFKNSEYEKVIQACEEIDRLDPGNFTARVFRKKAENTIASETETKCVKKLKEAWAALETEYKKNPVAFVRI